MLLGSMMNGCGGFGGGAFNNPIWALIIVGLLRQWGFDGNGNNSQLSQIQDTLNTNQGNTLLMNAITTQGTANVTATKELAAATNCNYNAMQGAINAIQQQIANKASQDGISFMQVVNAINNGDAALANTLQSCCCDMKTLMTNLNYEGRLADQAQAAFLGGKIDAQTTLINDKFCQLEMREMQNKLDAERAKNLALTNQLSQEHQSATFASMVAPMQADINEIKCKQPNTVTIPYSPVTPIPNCVAWNAAIYGGFPYGGGRSGQIWS
ncbi:MAG: hypothetical protein MJZ26_09180 [Fibrobacter sp.]|nr:hypothetical protein [Fibrobacter sp.]